jgi:hypothetical protein
MAPQHMYLAAAALMLIDALGYSFGAVRPLYRRLAPRDPYWSRRLLLNLLLANAGLYFTACFAFAGAYAASLQSPAATLTMLVALAACLYSAVTVPSLTPRDWVHSAPRGLAALAIIGGLTR